MRIPVTAALILALGLIRPVDMSFSARPEDLEGSGHDLEGSGSGDLSEQGKVQNVVDQPDREDRKFDITHWPAQDTGSEYVIIANSKSFLENKQIVAGIIAGGATGAALAAILAGMLIYTWHHKADVRYIQGQQAHGEEVV